MIILKLKLDNIYGFKDFELDLTYPKKIVNSIIENEHLAGFPNFRYKKVVILMGANASGKTTLGKAILGITRFINNPNPQSLRNIIGDKSQKASFTIDFVNKNNFLQRLTLETYNPAEIKYNYYKAIITPNCSYEKTVEKLEDHTDEFKERMYNIDKHYEWENTINCFFAYPNSDLLIDFEDIKKSLLLKIFKSVIGTLDPTLKDIKISKDLQNSFIIKRNNEEIIIQEGKLLNKEMLSSGTIEGINIALFLASMFINNNSFYYCDEHFSFIHSDIEKRIFGIMLSKLKDNEQLIFTTHNTDMCDLNLPKHSYAFLKKKLVGKDYQISVCYASDYLKRNTDSLRCAVENDVFSSLPDDSLLNDLE
ncbi:MAG: AAA family ATPase [Candidatus Riflebacteria bacterium]|nr:AAA family ATPase [Candidatus Riflebacteria bacterium]